jgi:hypothetical protein
VTRNYKRNAPRLCSQRSIRWTARSSEPACHAIGILRLIDQKTPAGIDLHLIVDNYATHKTPALKRWLIAHPRFTCTSRPTRRPGSTWWCASLPRSPETRRGAFKSGADLKGAIMQYLENHNGRPQTLRLDQVREPNPRKSRPSETSVRVTTPVRSFLNCRASGFVVCRACSIARK